METAKGTLPKSNDLLDLGGGAKEAKEREQLGQLVGGPARATSPHGHHADANQNGADEEGAEHDLHRLQLVAFFAEARVDNEVLVRVVPTT
jgi:hypothetical protein